MRLGKSGYAEAFVLKGGLLISSMTGVAQRTTMDMDTTVIGMDMDEGTVSEAVAAICAVDVADGMEYSFERIEPIREGDEYANWRAHLRARYGKIDAPVKIDITTEDDSARAHQYRYLMFEEGRSGCSRTRSKPCWPKSSRLSFPGNRQHARRDYDIHTLLRLKAGNKSIPARSRCRHRLQARLLGTMATTRPCSAVRRSDMMQGIGPLTSQHHPMRKATRRGRRSRTLNTSSSTTAGRGCAHRSAITPRAT
ncbi:MAG: nucleotidyl transferase AbiEii/AbiGii toxin family protein [Eggerthellaceae bacterium]